MQEIFERYGLTYASGSLPRQVASAWHKIIRLSLPNEFKPNEFNLVVNSEPAGSTVPRCEPVQSRTG